MSMVPAMDLGSEPAGGLPANLQAEQALLGCLLYDNSAFERLDDSFLGSHFFEPGNRKIFEVLSGAVRQGQIAEPILIAERLARDPSFEGLGGVGYLADLVDRAPPSTWAAQYAGIVLDLALRREIILLSGEASDAARTDREQPAREVIETLEQRLFALGEHKSAQGFRPFSEHLTGAIEMASAAYARDGGLAGLSTGLIDLDRKLGGLHPSDLIILAARPSMGKSALATNIAFYLAQRYAYQAQPDGSRKTTSGAIVGFFSLEMSGEQLALRILAEQSGVSSDRLRKGDVQPHEFGRVRDAAILIEQAPLHIDASGGLSIGKLATRARRLKRTTGLDLIVVDYLQLATSPDRRGEGRVQEVSEITQGLKALAKELEVPVLALAQLSRAVENRDDKKPQLADLRESGSIEQDADVVMFLYREEYYLGRSEPKPDTLEHDKWRTALDACRGVAEVIIGKARHGPIGTVRLAFNADLTKFSNLSREGQYDPSMARLPYGADRD